VALLIAGTTKRLVFHIPRIPVFGFLYFNFLASFYITFLSDDIATSISKQILSVLFLIIMPGLLARTSLFPYYCYIFMFTYRLRYVRISVFCCFHASFLAYWVMQVCAWSFIVSYDVFRLC